MNEFITLLLVTPTNGGVQRTKIEIRPSAIIAIENKGSSSKVLLSNGKEISVHQTSEEIKDILKKAATIKLD